MLHEEIRTTGAVVMGRRAYDMAKGDLTDYEYQVPIFVLTHDVPEQAHNSALPQDTGLLASTIIAVTWL